jgi:hypothetical protein
MEKEERKRETPYENKGVQSKRIQGVRGGARV